MTPGLQCVAICVVVLACAPLAAQRPSDPAMLAPQAAPPLDYVAVPNAITLPAGVTTGPTASAAFDPAGHLVVLTRGPEAIFEFDEHGSFLRSYGGSLFTRAHGLRVDPAGNLWATDVGAHVVYKLDRQGRVLMTLGVKGEAGEWSESAGSHKLNQPTDIAVAPNGDVFISEGHTPGANGDARVLKFDKSGRFLMQWGGKGSEPGRFQVAHGLAIDVDSARTAQSGAATEPGTGEPQVVAQVPEQRHVVVAVKGSGGSVHVQIDHVMKSSQWQIISHALQVHVARGARLGRRAGRAVFGRKPHLSRDGGGRL